MFKINLKNLVYEKAIKIKIDGKKLKFILLKKITRSQITGVLFKLFKIFGIEKTIPQKSQVLNNSKVNKFYDMAHNIFFIRIL